MSAHTNEALARWLAVNQPKVFEALVAKSRQHQLNGVTDFLKSVGTSFGSAVKSVGSFLSSKDGMATLGAIGGIYLQTKAQKDALKLQVQLAQAGQPLANIQSTGPTPSASPIYVDPATGAAYPFTSSLAQQLRPKTNWMPILIGGGLAIALIFMLRR